MNTRPHISHSQGQFQQLNIVVDRLQWGQPFGRRNFRRQKVIQEEEITSA